MDHKLCIPFSFKVLKLMPAFALTTLVLGTYAGYLTTFVIPLIYREYPELMFYPKETQFEVGVSYLSISGFFMFWIVFSLMKASLTNPGVIPQEFQVETLNNACQVYDEWANQHFGLQTLSKKFKTHTDFIKEVFEDRTQT